MAVLVIEDLCVEVSVPHRRPVRVLDGVGLRLEAGSTLGLVGESGSGKSITALSVLGLLPAPAARIVSGSIRLDGEELVGAANERLRRLRGGEIAMVFQDPMTSLDPVFTVGDQIAEAILLHRRMPRREAWRLAVEMLGRVGIADPSSRARAYPHQLSGGMRQRVMVAMAIACRPRVLIADEPTTALDVTTAAGIFDLLDDIRHEFGISILLVSHDMAAIARMADAVAVMHAGRIVETGAADEVLDRPRHPYTRELLACAQSFAGTGHRAACHRPGES